MGKQDTIWGFGAKISNYQGFFIGQQLTYVYNVNDDGTKQTTEATVQDLVHSGIKIAYKDSAGKVFSEVVKYARFKDKLMDSDFDPDRYHHLPSGILWIKLCAYAVITSETIFPKVEPTATTIRHSLVSSRFRLSWR